MPKSIPKTQKIWNLENLGLNFRGPNAQCDSALLKQNWPALDLSNNTNLLNKELQWIEAEVELDFLFCVL